MATGPLVRAVADAFLGSRLAKPDLPAPRQAAGGPERGPAQTYGPAELAEFAGVYFSDELESQYRLFVEGGRLRVRRGFEREARTLEAGARDQFSAAGSTLRFRRAPDGGVSGLTVDAPPIRGIGFVKR